MGCIVTNGIGSRKKSKDYEIDVLELVRGIWSRKWLVISGAALGAVLAAAYAFFSEPVYESRVAVLPPSLSDVAGFNIVRGKDSGLSPFTVSQVYSVFIRNLQSEGTQRRFFREIYLPSLQQSEGSIDVLYRAFSEDLRIVPPTKELPERYTVVLNRHDPQEAAKWAKQYIDLAAQRSMDEMRGNAQRELEVKGRNIQQQIDTLRQVVKERRTDRIVRLKEALQVAEAVGVERPPLIGPQADQQLSAIMEGSLMYMRGTKALRAEIGALEARSSDDPFIPALRGLQEQLALYESKKLNFDRVAVFRQDGSVEVPDEPVRPKKNFILLLGVLGGGVLGGLAALSWFLFRGKRIDGVD
ncbi:MULTISPECIES: LPS O-antigen chain length determinant protein WzzB [Pseudomonas aeruginosa group]|uniref:LPS O-antigen chain length determinant protein WzzB n=1 Tax=Pseudomonas aeruginosa group TaxID=136841 RepID=UPI00071B743B|nr:Wzz/FepE/Etk N-terminal domain-containing protein [Pseudomonas aeruginosa]KSR48696.1 chain-length determining protein [Pseudomonas aeruginosa]RPV07658.1 chain-length determining protein [Pseudomonas aeruginosa]